MIAQRQLFAQGIASEDDDSGRFLRMIAPLLRILNEQIETIEVSNYNMLEMID